jgi:L-ornithine N5-monooxygenase
MSQIYDIIGIGFGPSNLSLAINIDELKQHGKTASFSAIFLEQSHQFHWHKDMLLDGMDMQISFIKDLVTLRNPTSHYSFLNYLKDKGRLEAFANLRSFFPTRIEFHDYLTWTAEKLNDYVKYSQRVFSISPYGDKPYNVVQVLTKDLNTNQINQYLGKNIVIAIGGKPTLPQFVEASPESKRVWHTGSFLSKIDHYKEKSDEPYHFVVIGGGQSSAEVTHNLYTSFPNSKITAIHRKFGYKPADDSEFINEIFNPSEVDLFYNAPKECQNYILKEHRDTNYSVVDVDLIKSLYNIKYQELVTGQHRLIFKSLSNVTSVKDFEDLVEVSINRPHLQESEVISADAVILGTGYSRSNMPKILESVQDYLCLNDFGEVIVNRNHKMLTNFELTAGLFIQGSNEHTHGLSDTLLSILPIRSEEILKEIFFPCQKSLATNSMQSNLISNPVLTSSKG